MTRLCKVCGLEKDIMGFQKDNHIYRNPTCRSCHNIRTRELRKLDPNKYQDYSRNYRRKSGIKAKQSVYAKQHREENLEENRIKEKERMRRLRSDSDYHERELVRKHRYYQQDRAKNLIAAKKHQGKRQQFLNKLKYKPCADCGVIYSPCSMDFDHTGDNKFGNISEMKSYSLDRILAEAAKCDVVCSNCHRVRTAIRKGSDLSLYTLKPIDLTGPIAYLRWEGPSGGGLIPSNP